MIAVDTSVLIAIVLNETEADACCAALEIQDRLLISTGTVAEALIAAARRNVGEEMVKLVDGLGLKIVSVTPASARRIAQVYAKWVKGVHPAPLNFGDCFANSIRSRTFRPCSL